jgi:hypothetical protein
MPVPYNMTMELALFTTNLDEHFQILEQIMILFNPQIDIQKTDDPFDWTRISSVKLLAINNELNYPSGTERRVIQSSLQFSVEMNMAVPAKIRSDYIASIRMRVAAVNDITGGSAAILDQLDSGEFNYAEVFNFNRDVELP